MQSTGVGSAVVVVAVFVALVGLTAAEAEPKADGGYAAPAPICQTHYVTKYKNQIKQIPVRHTVFKTQVHPTEVYEPKFEEVYKTVLKNQFLPKYVTTTQYVDQVKYVTDYKVVIQTDYQPLFVTQTQVIPTYITETNYHTVDKLNVGYQTLVETQVLPTYLTTQEIVYETQYLTKVVPEYNTVYKTIHQYKTVCPKPAYGY